MRSRVVVGMFVTALLLAGCDTSRGDYTSEAAVETGPCPQIGEPEFDEVYARQSMQLVASPLLRDDQYAAVHEYTVSVAAPDCVEVNRVWISADGTVSFTETSTRGVIAQGFLRDDSWINCGLARGGSYNDSLEFFRNRTADDLLTDERCDTVAE